MKKMVLRKGLTSHYWYQNTGEKSSPHQWGMGLDGGE
jgi:hypothetical protein